MIVKSVQGLGKSVGEKELFRDVSFGIDERDRIALIGVNGCGKSTLLKILAGAEKPDEGSMTTRQGLRMEMLPQNPVFDDNHTVLEHLFSSDLHEAALVREYEGLCRALEHSPSDERLLSSFSTVSRKMDAAGAWEYETRAKTVLTRLQIEDFGARLGELSGGYRKRLALARVLLAEPEMMLLDEPTNHLDADTIAWLEDYLKGFQGGVVLVTHDRYFLDRVANRIMEMERGKVREYRGNFTSYLAAKVEQAELEARIEDRRQNILRSELEWLRRGAKARSTKQKARIGRVEQLQEAEPERKADKISFSMVGRRLGKKVVELHGINKSYGNKELISKFSHTFSRGERLGVIGPNGCGKSTLSRLILGREAVDGGVVKIGDTVRFACYTQESEGLDPRERAIDYVTREGGEMLRTEDGAVLPAADVMRRFLFTNQMLYAPVEKLSGGERRRLYLVRTLMQSANFLILDEPTNDLDIATLEALEDFLEGFEGCLLVISHDRYFLDRTVDHLLSFEGNGRLHIYPGNYGTYVRMKAEDEAARRLAEGAHDVSSTKKSQIGGAQQGKGKDAKGEKERRITYGEEFELRRLVEQMPELEHRVAELEEEVAAAATDYSKLKGILEEKQRAQKALDDAMARWEELATLAEKKN